MSNSSQVQNIVIDEEAAGQRVDNYLMRRLKGLPKSRIYRIIRKGEVRLNKKRCKPDTRVAAGDLLRVPPIARLAERSTAVGNFSDLDALILHEDDNLLIINKPAGMAVHGGSGVSVGVIESLRHHHQHGDKLELVHRLDRGTSGCLMVAKRRRYLKCLQDALRQTGKIRKQYLAMVHGQWPEAIKVLEQPLLTASRQGRERVTRVATGGKSARTEFRVIATATEASLIQAFPVTGRTHQIRVHARWARHPIFGDDRYGDATLDAAAGFSGRLLLHARSLRIPALEDFPEIWVEAPLDQSYASEVEARFGSII